MPISALKPSITCAAPKASFPALESSHAVAYALKLAKTMRPDQTILVNLSGRGDKTSAPWPTCQR